MTGHLTWSEFLEQLEAQSYSLHDNASDTMKQ